MMNTDIRCFVVLNSDDIEDFMNKQDSEELKDFINRHMVDREELNVYFSSLFYQWVYEYQTQPVSVDDSTDTIDGLARNYLNKVLGEIRPICENFVYVSKNRDIIHSPYNGQLLIQYTIKINRRDLNVVKLKMGSLYNTISNTLRNPIKIG